MLSDTVADQASEMSRKHRTGHGTVRSPPTTKRKVAIRSVISRWCTRASSVRFE
jgi:hypothetical protein